MAVAQQGRTVCVPSPCHPGWDEPCPVAAALGLREVAQAGRADLPSAGDHQGVSRAAADGAHLQRHGAGRRAGPRSAGILRRPPAHLPVPARPEERPEESRQKDVRAFCYTSRGGGGEEGGKGKVVGVPVPGRGVPWSLALGSSVPPVAQETLRQARPQSAISLLFRGSGCVYTRV